MKKIIEKFKEYDIDITNEQADKLYKFYIMLKEKNKVINLTSIVEYDEVILKHFIDSATIKESKIEIDNKKIIDVGTGAGFPGIVLAILYPSSDFTLLDSLNKRIKFLNEVITELSIENVKLVHSRAEDYAKQYSFTFDIVVSRAVSHMSNLAKYCIPFLKKNSYFIAYKGNYTLEEEKESYSTIKKLGASNINIIRFNLLHTDNIRTLVCIKK